MYLRASKESASEELSSQQAYSPLRVDKGRVALQEPHNGRRVDFALRRARSRASLSGRVACTFSVDERASLLS